MIRFFLSCIAFLFLTACLSWPEMPSDTTAPAPPAGQYHFGWKLSGNRAVAPLQIFDDGYRTWLQFPPGQVAPAIFARLPHGDQLLSPKIGADGLLMLDGVWSPLILRGGSLQSVALRLNALAMPGTDRAPAKLEAAGAVSLPVTSITPSTPPSVSAVPIPPAVPATPATSVIPMPQADTSHPATVFQVSPADGTLRATLARWAKTAGWTFSLEHWAVDADIPIVASASFSLPFEEAVQALVSSTELSEQPLRPCFYTNQVLRIVAHTQACDRNVVGAD